ncbi:MBL fold metallo-hydrolase [Noviherbaspirillum cavernae]|uniref:MBL fold metallo-hydrolase n=1 Tax=Noviherbaspirillum cavernae TaxID=2320862 RepID=A0A418WVF1_9BURK|nr:MBL fold metallo-hydrolase [Noviherbaspirillum cavernae]RJF96660.1 MBL fold metallo-hydrolase [Noviherbaspirillum cavernae]
MKITQLRNATILIDIGADRILVDPMLARKDALPPLRILGGRTQRNPIVELPAEAEAALESVTHCLITHCQKGHFDHLDRAGMKWLREKRIPVICTPHDAGYLSERGLNVRPLPPHHEQPSSFLGGHIRTVRCTHGRGMIGMLMEHGVGYLIEVPGEPSLYLSGDTVLTPRIRDFVSRHQPDISIVPAGGARMDIGQDIIMGVDEVIEFTHLSRGLVVANHLEALSHCPVTRTELADAATRAGVASQLRILADGESWLASAPGSVLSSSLQREMVS